MENSLALTLNDISEQINRYGSIVIFLFGVVGNLLNVLVLWRKPLRQNPCAWLFLVASVVNTLAIVSGITTRMLSGWAVDPTATISWLCKLRTFTMLVSRTIAPWLLVLAMFDRWIISSLKVDRRRRSTLKNAQRGALVVTIIAILLFAHIFYCYEANQRNTPLKCYYRNGRCTLATDLIAFIMMIIVPTVVNATFSLMTISNIHRSQRRIQAMNGITLSISTHEMPITLRSSKRIDRDLMKMLLVQVTFLIIFTLPFVAQKIYTTFRPNKSPLETTIDSLIYNIALLSAYLTNGMPFYIYTLLGGNIFRQSLIHLFRRH